MPEHESSSSGMIEKIQLLNMTTQNGNSTKPIGLRISTRQIKTKHQNTRCDPIDSCLVLITMNHTDSIDVRSGLSTFLRMNQDFDKSAANCFLSMRTYASQTQKYR